MTASQNELAALSLVKQIKQCYEMTFEKAGESLDWAIRCGEFLSQAKTHLGHGAFGGFVEQNFDFCQRRAQDFMKLYKDLHQIPKAKRSSLLKAAGSINSLQKILPRTPHQGDTPPEPPESPQTPPVPDRADEPPERPKERELANGAPESLAKRQPVKAKPLPPRQLDRSSYYRQWDYAISALVRLVEIIAEGVGERHGTHHVAIKDALNTATEQMIEWMEVE